MPVRNCPHCHATVDVPAADTEEIVCSSCGSSFRLEQEKTRSVVRDQRRLGRFELLTEVGSGAFGAVWKARDAGLGRYVAVKVPHPGRLQTREDLERFLREGRSAAQLRHPGIVSVHEVGDHAGLPYLVADFITGITLADLLTAGRPDERQAVDLVVQLADALEYAHSMGVIHRDIKPSNIMLERPPALQGQQKQGQELGKPLLMDFGLARLAEADGTLTQEGDILGTPAYMSPEQAAGQGHKVDRRSDVYSLGVVLYQLLTGELPFRGNARMILDQVLRAEPIPPCRSNPRLPRDLETITLKCIAKEPIRRYQSAAELAADLRRWRAGEPVQARPVGPAERLWRWCRRNPAQAGLTAAVFAVMLIGTLVSAFFAVEADRRADEAEYHAKVADEEKGKATASAQLARAETARANRALYAAKMNLAQVLREDDRIQSVLGLLAEVEPKSPSDDDLRGWEWYYQRRQCYREFRRFEGHTSWAFRVCFSPDGRYLATASIDGTTRLWDVASGKELRRREGGYIPPAGPMGPTLAYVDVAFHPSGKKVAVASGKEVFTLEVPGWKEIRRFEGPTNGVRCVCYSPDGQWLAAGQGDGPEPSKPPRGKVHVWNAQTGEPVYASSHEHGVMRLAFHPDGRELAVTTNHHLQVLNAANGQVLRRLEPMATFMEVAYSPDGRWLATTDWSPAVVLREAGSGKIVHEFKNNRGVFQGLAFSPDGRLLAASNHDDTVHFWNLTTMDKLPRLTGHQGDPLSIAFSPDGHCLATVSAVHASARLWRPPFLLPTSPPWGQGIVDEARLFLGHRDRVWSVAVHLDGKECASAGSDKTVRLWDITTGQEIRTLTEKDCDIVYDVAYSPNGKRVASANRNGVAYLWDRETGKVLHRLGGHSSYVRSVAFHPAGHHLASASGVWDKEQKKWVGGEIMIWNVATGDKLLTLKGHGGLVMRVCYDSTGRLLASASTDRAVTIWDGATGRELRTMRGHEGTVQALAFTPDGATLASGGADDSIRFWDVATGEPKRVLRGFTGRVNDLQFSADGRRLVSVTGGMVGWNEMRVWDAVGGFELFSHRDQSFFSFERIAFHPDGYRILTCGDDNHTLQLWDARPLTPDVQIEREAVALLDYLFGLPLPKEAAREWVRHRAPVADDVRRLALELLERYREEQDPKRYAEASRRLIRLPYSTSQCYGFAKRQAEEACQRSPGQPAHFTTLALAHYRLADYENAYSVLTRVRPRPVDDRDPVGLTCLAMIQHRLGSPEQARARLNHLRELLKKGDWPKNEEANQLFAEAVALIEGRPSEGKP